MGRGNRWHEDFEGREIATLRSNMTEKWFFSTLSGHVPSDNALIVEIVNLFFTGGLLKCNRVNVVLTYIPASRENVKIPYNSMIYLS